MLLLAQLRREGRNEEANDLKSALCNRNQFISGETIPLEKTVPATILMLEPEVTLKLLELTVGSGIPQEKLLELLPAARNHEENWPVFTTYIDAYEAVLAELPKTFERSIRLGDSNWAWVLGGDRHELEPFRLSLLSGSFAFVFFGQEQGNVLKKLSRDQQARVGTWQIDLPAFMVGWSPAFSICFHEEAVHAEWSKRYPALASKSVSNGYGAFFMYEGLMELSMKHQYMSSLQIAPNKKARIELAPLDGVEVINGFKLAS